MGYGWGRGREVNVNKLLQNGGLPTLQERKRFSKSEEYECSHSPTSRQSHIDPSVFSLYRYLSLHLHKPSLYCLAAVLFPSLAFWTHQIYIRFLWRRNWVIFAFSIFQFVNFLLQNALSVGQRVDECIVARDVGNVLIYEKPYTVIV